LLETAAGVNTPPRAWLLDHGIPNYPMRKGENRNARAPTAERCSTDSQLSQSRPRRSLSNVENSSTEKFRNIIRAAVSAFSPSSTLTKY
jgi:hypothetical protein